MSTTQHIQNIKKIKNKIDDTEENNNKLVKYFETKPIKVFRLGQVHGLFFLLRHNGHSF